MPVGGENSGEEAARAAACLARLHLPQPDGVLIADPSPENQAWLRAEYPGLNLHLTDAASLRAAVLERHGAALRDEAVDGLGRRLPELSARRVFSRGQMLVLPLLAAAFLAALALRPEAVLRLLVLLLSAALVASGLFRALLAWIGGGKPAPAPPLPRRGLPRYTVLVPLYREAAVLPGLGRALKLREVLGASQTQQLQGEVEIDGGYFGGYIKPANYAHHRRDRRLWQNQNGKRECVVVMRERNGRTLPFVSSEHNAVALVSQHVAQGSTIHADEGSSWDLLHDNFNTKRINHSECYSDGEACTNGAESYFSRLRRAEIGTHHSVAGPYLGAYAAEMAWREDFRRKSNGSQYMSVVNGALHHPVSRKWKGYWQRRAA